MIKFNLVILNKMREITGGVHFQSMADHAVWISNEVVMYRNFLQHIYKHFLYNSIGLYL